MDRGARPTDVSPENSVFGRDRRRARRHRVHTPAYASLSGSAQGSVVELSEILNISETGMCIQAGSPMKINRLLPLCLDLSATSTRIHIVGHVVWSDPSGKTGIRFPELSEVARDQLREWLSANETAEQAAKARMPAAPEPEIDNAEVHAQLAKPSTSPGYTSLVNEWAEIEKEVDICGPELDAALHIVAQRALTLTWASGTAIALINSLRRTEMVCRARAGTDSPELGARLEAGSGFSGECIRGKTAITCDDTEYDSRVDRRSCRALGIRSIVACPVKRNDEIIGIIEVFSPEPAAFWENDIRILQRLSKYVALAVTRAEHARSTVLAFPLGDSVESTPELNLLHSSLDPGAGPKRPSMLRKVALLAVGVLALTMIIWAAAPWLANLGAGGSGFGIPASAAADSTQDTYVTLNIKDLKKVAAQGNASAEYALGKRYANGDGIKQDYREAKLWYLKAAEQGHVHAQSKVAASYWEGRGGPQDYSKAYFWALLAQAGGDETSPAIVMSSAAHLSPAQTAAQQKQAEQWLHSHHIGHDSAQ